MHTVYVEHATVEVRPDRNVERSPETAFEQFRKYEIDMVRQAIVKSQDTTGRQWFIAPHGSQELRLSHEPHSVGEMVELPLEVLEMQRPKERIVVIGWTYVVVHHSKHG